MQSMSKQCLCLPATVQDLLSGLEQAPCRGIDCWDCNALVSSFGLVSLVCVSHTCSGLCQPDHVDHAPLLCERSYEVYEAFL